MCEAEKHALEYMTTTLSSWLLRVTADLTLYQPADPLSYLRSACTNAIFWEGECLSQSEFSAEAAEAYTAAVVTPLMEGLFEGILRAGDPLPSNPGEAGLPLVQEGGALAGIAAAGLATLEQAPSQGVRRTCKVMLPYEAPTEYAHGGVGLEEEPVVPRAELEAYIQSRQPPK